MTDTSKDLSDNLGALRGARILLAVSGGIAAYKAAELTRMLQKNGATVRVILTQSARSFIGAATFEGLTHEPVPSSVFDDASKTHHVTLARWADLTIVAPATANVIAKCALGIADDLVSSTLLMRGGPLLIAPAMHTEMWMQPATQHHVETLRGLGITFEGPDEGELSIGDTGLGRMAEPAEIVRAAARALSARGDMTGMRVLVTAGGTQEAIDPVRFIGNRSSGKMGYAIASEASKRGADVALVSGPSSLPDPEHVRVVRIRTAQEMLHAVLDRFDHADIVIKAAAVADFRPAKPAPSKIHKDDGLPTIELEPTVDILSELGKRKSHQLLVGFSAETDDGVARARKKLTSKNLDLIIANTVSDPGAGFEHDTNAAMMLARDGSERELPLQHKSQMARAICDEIVRSMGKVKGFEAARVRSKGQEEF